MYIVVAQLLKGLMADAADPILSLSETLMGVSGTLWRPLGEPGGVPGVAEGAPGRIHCKQSLYIQRISANETLLQ